MRWPQRVASVLFLVLLLAGPPVVLVRFVGWPIGRWPSRQQVQAWLEQPLTEQTLTFALAVLAWLVWLFLAGTVAVRMLVRMRAGARWLRRMPLPTPMQATATGMAGAAVLGAGTSAVAAPVDNPASTAVGTLDHDDGGVSGRRADPGGGARAAADGVAVPGGWLPRATAEQIAAAAALVWLRRRRGYRPNPAGPQTRDDADLAPLPATVTAVRATLAPPAPDDLHPEHPAADAEPATGVASGGLSPAVADFPPAGVSLVGGGAADAARGIVVTVLLRGLRHPAGGVRVITTRADLTALLGPTAAQVYGVSGLHVAATVEDAVAALEAELLRRAHPAAATGGGQVGGTPDGDGPLLLLTHTPALPGISTRLAAALHSGAGAATAVLLGAWPAGAVWQVDPTGHTLDPRPPHRPTPRLCVLDAVATIDLLTVISHAAPISSVPTPVEDAAASRVRIPQQANRRATGRRTPTRPARRVDLRVLGEPALLYDGRPVTIRRSAAMQAMVFLAVHPHGAASRQLIKAIWPGPPAHTVTGRLYTTLSELRTTIHAAYGLTIVEHANDRYRLAHEHVDTDLWRLQDVVQQAGTAVAGRAAAWRTVVDSYTGDLAAGQPWPWLDVPREALRRHVIDAYTALAAAQDDPHLALSVLQDAIRVDPFNEDLHRRTMHALAATGNHTAVEALLDSYARRLAGAHLEPSDDLRHLAAQLREGQRLPRR